MFGKSKRRIAELEKHLGDMTEVANEWAKDALIAETRAAEYQTDWMKLNDQHIKLKSDLAKMTKERDSWRDRQMVAHAEATGNLDTANTEKARRVSAEKKLRAAEKQREDLALALHDRTQVVKEGARKPTKKEAAKRILRVRDATDSEGDLIFHAHLETYDRRILDALANDYNLTLAFPGEYNDYEREEVGWELPAQDA